MQNFKRQFLPIILLPVLLVTVIAQTDAQTVYGFAGKPWDPETGLYDYGYRDYQPQTGRFTTEDPIRDGHNWYSYVNQDPVNYVDLLGLKNWFILSPYRMNSGEWATEKLTGDTDLIGQAGCALTLMTNVLKSIGVETDPLQVNKQYVHEGRIYWGEASAGNGLAVATYNEYSAAQYQSQEDDIYNRYYTGIKVHYDDGHGTHWVGTNGVEIIDGVTYFVVSPTSINDENLNSEIRKNTGWIIEKDHVLVPEAAVFGAVVFTQEKTL